MTANLLLKKTSYVKRNERHEIRVEVKDLRKKSGPHPGDEVCFYRKYFFLNLGVKYKCFANSTKYSDRSLDGSLDSFRRFRHKGYLRIWTKTLIIYEKPLGICRVIFPIIGPRVKTKEMRSLNLSKSVLLMRIPIMPIFVLFEFSWVPMESFPFLSKLTIFFFVKRKWWKNWNLSLKYSIMCTIAGCTTQLCTRIHVDLTLFRFVKWYYIQEISFFFVHNRL